MYLLWVLCSNLHPPHQLVVAFILHLDGLLQNPNLRVKCVFELAFEHLRRCVPRASILITILRLGDLPQNSDSKVTRIFERALEHLSQGWTALRRSKVLSS